MTDTYRPIGPTGSVADIGGQLVHYHDLGQGPPVMLLHGAGAGVSGMSSFASNVDTLADAHRVLVVDLPGFGRSPAPHGGLTEPLGEHAGVLLGLLDALELPEVRLVGHSYGGGVALRMALDHPGRIRGLVLVASLGFTPPAGSGYPTEGSLCLNRFTSAPSAGRMRELIECMVYDRGAVTEEIVAARLESATVGVDLRSAAELARRLVCRTARSSFELSNELDGLAQPVLLVWGDSDRFVPLGAALNGLSRLDNGRLHVFARCGHLPHSEFAAEFNALVLDFLSTSAR